MFLKNSIEGCDHIKTSPYFLLIVNAFLAIGLTVLSFQYIQPKNCYRFCDDSVGRACPQGACAFGEQKAGWPLPAFKDNPGGGSPTGGWGLLGPEDLPLGLPMILDVLFYSALVLMVLYGIRFFRHQAFPQKLFLWSLPLNAFLGAALWVFYIIFAFTMGFRMIGRGHSDSVYVDTSEGREAIEAFVPRVSVPLDEVIDYYGNPDEVWFTSENASAVTRTDLLLYWDSVHMFVLLPQVADNSYPLQRKTAVERIIYFYETPDITAVAGRQVGEKAAWRGYGNYQP